MFKYALNLILRRKLRTVLTSLGIMIAVMLMTFILFGMSDLQRAILTQFSSVFKPTDLYVSSQDMGMFGGMISAPTKEDEKKEKVIINSNVKESIENVRGVEKVIPIFVINGLEVYLEGDDIAYPSNILQSYNLNGDDEAFGSFFGNDPVLKENGIFVSKFVVSYFETTSEEILGKKIIAKSVPTYSFISVANKDMIGKEYEFVVQGVVDTANDAFWINSEKALNMLVDLGGFQSRDEYIDEVGYSQLLVQTSQEYTSSVEKKLTKEMNLSVMSTDTIIQFISTLTNGLTVALIIFGAISAVVASIGIINTMIMSIYEQTREIGIIKAIGASNAQVLIIFLIQSALIGLIGGILGLSITYVLMQVSDPYIVQILKEQGFSAIDKFFYFQPLNAFYITFGSIVVGVLAGIYPAMKAAKLNPVNALRYE